MAPQTNAAFQRALQAHLETSDARTFTSEATPDDVLREIEEYETANRQTAGRRYTSRFSVLIERFQGFFSAVDAFVSSNPEIAGLVWGGLRFIIQTVSNFTSYFEQVVAVLETISQNLYFYHSYATELYRKSDRVMVALADVYGDMLIVLMTVKKTFINSKNQERSFFSIASRVLNPFSTPFARIATNFDHRRGLLEEEALHADREAKNRAQQREDIDKLLRILRFEEVVCEDKHKSSHKKILPNTDSGCWFLERDDYQEWRQADSSTGSAGLFWLHGQPGTGKTILASIVIDDLKTYSSANASVAYFYCDYKSDEKTRPINILRSLLGQLISGFQPPVPPSVADILETYSSEYKSVSFVIDGMDECQDRAEILPELHRLSGCIRLFVTSRDEDDIGESFRCYQKHELHISAAHTHEDIKQFVVGTLDNHMRANPSFVRDTSIIDEIIQMVVGQANGMFLLVYFQLKNILECDSDARIREEIGNLPRGLDETFVRAIKCIHSHPSRDRLMRLLRWMVCTQAIPLDSLFEAIAVDDMGDSWNPDRMVNDERRLIKACAHLVTVADGENPIVMFPHFSVYRFLASNPMSWEETLPQYHAYPLPDAYKTVASSCAKFFSIIDCPDPWRLITSVLKGWRNHAGVLDEPALLSLMFNAPLQVDPQPANPLLVFPCATYLEATKCTFVLCPENAYNVFTSTGDTGFGGVSLREVFPKVDTAKLYSCKFVLLDSSHMNLYHGPVQGRLTFSGNYPHATRVKMEHYTFFHGRNSWSIVPNENVFQHERTSREITSIFKDFDRIDAYDGEFFHSTAFCMFHYDSIMYSFSHDVLIPT